jgi:hypothetical protein
MRFRQPSRSGGSPSSRPSALARGHPALALQRLAGNRVTAGVIHLARQQPVPPSPNPLPPPPEPSFEFRAVATALRKSGARPGESSAKVLRLQVLLNIVLGERVLSADGVYGPRTEAEVLNFQLSTRRAAPAPPGPNPLPPPKPPPPGPTPEPPSELEATGVADPATVDALEVAARDGSGKDVKEGFRLIRDKRHAFKLSLLSAIQNVDRLVVADGLAEHFPGNEFSYWEAVAEHANGRLAKARALYEAIVADGNEGEWEGLIRNCEFQLEFLGRGDPPHVEFNPDPNLEEGGGT